MKRIKLVTIDLDGTLADTVPELLKSMNAAREFFGYEKIDRARLLKAINGGAREFVRGSFPEGLSEAEVDLAYSVYFKNYSIFSCETRKCYDGIKGALSQLSCAGISLAVLTNKRQDMADKIIEQIFPERPFFRIVGDGAGYPKKPEPNSLLALMREVGAEAYETVHVGDSDVDMQTAKRAGAFALGVSWGYRERDVLMASGADAIADKPCDIAKIILADIPSTFAKCAIDNR